MIETYYSIKELSLLIKISRITIWRWIRDGKLPAVKAGKQVRIKYSDIINFLESK